MRLGKKYGIEMRPLWPYACVSAPGFCLALSRNGIALHLGRVPQTEGY